MSDSSATAASEEFDSSDLRSLAMDSTALKFKLDAESQDTPDQLKIRGEVNFWVQIKIALEARRQPWKRGSEICGKLCIHWALIGSRSQGADGALMAVKRQSEMEQDVGFDGSGIGKRWAGGNLEGGIEGEEKRDFDLWKRMITSLEISRSVLGIDEPWGKLCYITVFRDWAPLADLFSHREHAYVKFPGPVTTFNYSYVNIDSKMIHWSDLKADLNVIASFPGDVDNIKEQRENLMYFEHQQEVYLLEYRAYLDSLSYFESDLTVFIKEKIWDVDVILCDLAKGNWRGLI